MTAAKKGRAPKHDNDAVLRVLRKAIDESPVDAPASNHIPRGGRTTTKAEFRRYFDLGIATADDTPAAKRSAFNRACKRLQDAGKMEVWGSTYG